MDIEAGILMTEDVMRVWGGTPKPMYAESTEPAIVEKPDVMVRSDDRSEVIQYVMQTSGTYGAQIPS